MFINVVLIIHLMLAIALVAVVLLQRSEGGALGIGGGGGMGGFMTARGSGNVLTRITATLAALFMLTSIGLAIMAGGRGAERSIMSQPAAEAPAQPAPPSAPATPTVPVAK